MSPPLFAPLPLGKKISDLIKRLRSQEAVDAKPHEIESLTDEAADALEAANARIAKFERILDGLPQDAIDGGRTARGISAHAKQLESRIAELNAIINTPHAGDFMKAVSIEAEHQRQRWGSEQDAGKTNPDWNALIAYLLAKALTAMATGNREKSEHHVITAAAALKNWHAAVTGQDNAMRPGCADGGHPGAADPVVCGASHAQE